MSGASFQELFLLIAIGLVVLGPKRLPQVANQIGSWVGQARRMTRMMKRQLEDEINMDLDSFDVQKQLGLEDTPQQPPAPTGKPTKPWTHEQATTGAATTGGAAAVGSTAATAAAAESEAARELTSGATDEEREELPDDYSPAHAAHEVGTGVGDDPMDDPTDDPVDEHAYIDDVELDEAQAAATNDAEPPEKKQETA